ncbi:PLDc N-terminal domain-containing protein [Rhodococcus qingshengii]|uniref:PLDc N-terminal domain-containing protein n=1 Tax=Rhodococcus qingshengii TaxID=334542 RepID=UPI001C242B4C|nr:PLDc N-terminal domain-containing protein [Rhodococcus qingshengii]QXC40720.1 PLD nuclease N-terminal domain-containing protein [Rhodococcus qingshengii]
MPYALFGLITMLLWIFCIVDVITRDDAYIQYLPKVVWILIIIFLPTLGSVLWLVVGRGQNAPRGYVGPTGYGEYERPGRAVAQDPAADEAFLRQCRERAEEQRRIAKQQRRDGDADRM